MYLQTLPVAERTYLFKELYIETKIRNPKGRKPPLPPGFGIQGLGFRVSGPPPYYSQSYSDSDTYPFGV